MNQHAKFWDRIAEKYFNKSVKNPPIYQKKLLIIEQLLTSSSRVLEVGCGTGSTALHLANQVGQYDAYDFSKNMIRIASHRASEANIINIKFKAADVEVLKSPRGNYDVVMAHSVLHLIDNAERVVENMLNGLKDGGYIVLSLVMLNKLPMPLRALLMLGSKLGVIPHLVFKGHDDLLSLLSSKEFRTHTSLRVDKHNLFLVVQKMGQ
ncbi:class I SAM-dependent methyltransferase [Vibrio coralliilyticus]|uniref:class I SAM-dependent methyltransferase n=1 Tax=Vibrio coralliilyticus TaxID=190893 RepID=UPI0015606C4A|nr:class I SAM-dependent methyltransferase [Vibrio coralliilyticus]NRF62047.1 methyltransferase domain-containing protein [Vibrio coralliilyticus]